MYNLKFLTNLLDNKRTRPSTHVRDFFIYLYTSSGNDHEEDELAFKFIDETICIYSIEHECITSSQYIPYTEISHINFNPSAELTLINMSESEFTTLINNFPETETDRLVDE